MSTQRQLEHQVREAFEFVHDPGRIMFDPKGLVLAVSRLVVTLHRQPSLIEGRRVHHNLGREQWLWAVSVRNRLLETEEAANPRADDLF